MRTKTYYRTCPDCGAHLDPGEKCDCRDISGRIYNPAELTERKCFYLAMTDAAREARNAYKRAWYKAHPDKRKEYQERYWQRKAQSDKQKKAENGRNEGAGY